MVRTDASVFMQVAAFVLFSLLVFRFPSAVGEERGPKMVFCDDCHVGRCVYKNCENSVNCLGGLCSFDNCLNPKCRGGMCIFKNCTNPTCAGGLCRFYSTKTTLGEGYCSGGGCMIENQHIASNMRDAYAM